MHIVFARGVHNLSACNKGSWHTPTTRKLLRRQRSNATRNIINFLGISFDLELFKNGH